MDLHLQDIERGASSIYFFNHFFTEEHGARVWLQRAGAIIAQCGRFPCTLRRLETAGLCCTDLVLPVLFDQKLVRLLVPLL